ncbi:MAG: EpsI family protein [Gammaproteobacteria bacterium]|nr:EpsI family protein [Gammaproteobacteria bacterium]
MRWSSAAALGAPRLLALLGFLLAAALVYWPSSLALWRLWTDSQIREYTHGFAVLLTSLWLLYARRRRLAEQPLRPQPAALALLVLLSAVWVIAWQAAIQDLHLLLLPALLITASLAAFGWPMTRLAVFPLAFLSFALPIWSDAIGPLQHLSEAAVAVLIRLTGLPARMAGNLIELPGGTLEISGGCSGSHFLVVGLAFAALYGELLQASLARRLGWLALMAVIAVAANWLRIYAIALAAYATDMQTFLVTVDHYWFGWLMFAAGVGAFLWAADRLGGRPRDESPAQTATSAVCGAGSAVSWRRWSCVVFCMAVLPAMAYGLVLGGPARAEGIAIAWPAAPRDWTGPLPDGSTSWHPVYQHSTAAQMRRYVDARGREVELFAVIYRRQRHGVKLVMWGNSLLGGGGSIRLSERIVRTATGEWREETAVDASGSKSVIWSRYRIGRRTFVHPILSQLAYGVMDLFGEPVSSLVALRAVCAGECDAARARLAAAASLASRVRAAAPARYAPADSAA